MKINRNMWEKKDLFGVTWLGFSLGKSLLSINVESLYDVYPIAPNILLLQYESHDEIFPYSLL